jgi:GNAT superfamily N-acetyltransferase
MIALRAVAGELPAGLDVLRAEALAEGHGFLERLAGDWAAGVLRFERPGEALLYATFDTAPAGIGGLTLESVLPGALRMRRFYVRATHRRHGVGRELVTALLAGAGDRPVTVNSTAVAVAFWESLGFVADRRDGYSHVRR